MEMIEEARRDQPWTQAELAARAHMDQSTYSRYVTYQRSPPLAQIDALCRALGKNIGDLITAADEQTPQRYGPGGLK
jgi:transcriptional regulator with XRE-family HTH domain